MYLACVLFSITCISFLHSYFMIGENYYYQVYKIFYSRIGVLVRFGFFALIPELLLTQRDDFTNVKRILFFYFILLLHEAYLYAKVYKHRPGKGVMDEVKDLESIMDLKSRYVFDHSKSSYKVIKNTPHKIHEIIFIIKKIGGLFRLENIDVYKEELLKEAREIVRSVGGRYITGLDMFVAYLILSDEKTRFLDKHNLTKNDLVNILYWARNKYSLDRKQTFTVSFKGLGAFDWLAYGWNYEIKKYTQDFTLAALAGKSPPTAVGRKDEYEQFLVALSKGDKANILLIGEPGTGRSSLVKFFAYYSHIGWVPHSLAHKKIYTLLIDQLLAGVSTQGELEERLNLMLQDIVHSGNVILFVPNIENVLGGGGLNFDVSGVLYEYLKDNKVQIIGTSNNNMYKTIIEQKQAFVDQFEIIRLEEPSPETALFMLFEKATEIEDRYHVRLTYEAIKESVELSSSYIPDKYLPGKAIELLQSVSSSVKLESGRSNSSGPMTLFGKKYPIVTKKDVAAFIEQQTKVVLQEPGEKEKELLIHFEDKIHENFIAQEEAVKLVASTFRRLRTGFVNKKRPISVFLFMGPTGVGKTALAKVISQIYFHDENAMIRFDMSEFQTQEQMERLLGPKPGQGFIANTLVDQVHDHPFSVLLLDELEKAHPQILDLFLQVFDEGRLTDNAGRTISFINTIIIATTNAGSEAIREQTQQGVPMIQMKEQLVDYLMRTHMFRPELINRFDEVVVFNPLTQSDVLGVSKIMLTESLRRLEERHVFINFDESVIQKIAREGYDPEFGGRNIRRYIEESIEGLVSNKILSNEIQRGAHVSLSVDQNGQFVIQ